MNVAVIPARGGSKRIPLKNIKKFYGKPIIAYSIEEAKRSELFDRILVSTDSEEIAELAKGYGAEIPFLRPANLSDDFTPAGSVIAHAVNWIQKGMGELSAVCCIHATAPFINKDDLIKAYNIFNSKKWDFVFSATLFVSPVQRAFTRMKTGGIKMFNPKHFATRSQDLPEAYHDAGMFYWGKVDAWLNNIITFSEKSTIVKIPPYCAVDIDTEEDWARAELFMESLKREE